MDTDAERKKGERMESDTNQMILKAEKRILKGEGGDAVARRVSIGK